MDRQSYNRIYNEAGEGYNPYPKKTSVTPNWIIALGKRDSLMSRLSYISTDDTQYAETQRQLAEAEKTLLEAKKLAGLED